VNILRGKRKSLLLSGAGISVASGIPTFRGANGLWEREIDATKFLTMEAFKEDPRPIWEWHWEFREAMLKAKPNPCHQAIAKY